jgi:DNA-binding MarR family transcriptional regulator
MHAARVVDGRVVTSLVDDRMSGSPARFTEKQGQYLAFIASYTRQHGRPPAESDLRQFFSVTAPVVHQMIVGLERRGLISRVPGQSRTIKVALPDEELPVLQPMKTAAG